MNLRSPLRLSAVFLAAGFIATISEVQQVIKMSTAISTENSGLLAYLLPMFERNTDSKVQVIAVGIGKAL